MRAGSPARTRSRAAAAVRRPSTKVPRASSRARRDFCLARHRRRDDRGPTVAEFRGAAGSAWRMRAADGRLDLPDVLRRRPAAAADHAHVVQHEPARVRRHVLGRAEIDVASLHVARLAGVGLRRQLQRRDRFHPLDRLEHRAGPTAQFTPMMVAPRFSSSGANRSGGVPSSVLPSSSVVICAMIGRLDTERTASIAAPISFRSRNVSRMKRSTPPSTSACACSRKYSRASSTPVLPHGSMRMPSGPMAPGDVGAVAGRAPGDLGAVHVDVVQLVRQAERRELDAVGAEGIGLEDVGARAARTPGGPLRPAPPASGSSRRSSC